MSRRYFGTDGVRGKVGKSPITPDFVLRLGPAAGRTIRHRSGTSRPTVLIGKDTRISGYMLEAALEAGFSSAGVDVLLCGPIPTPAVAYLTRALRLDAGVVISASHNPYDDNGIKFFSQTGHKLPDAVEDEIEAMVAAEHDSSKNPSGSSVGRVINEEAMDKLYIDHIISTAPTKLNGLKVVMDCSNGANSLIAPVILRTLGAHVITIFNQPNGININNGCGSTHLEALQAKVLEEGADVGIANDGDADRCLAVDETGKPLDGDQIMLICALELMKKKELHDNVLVTTVMSNVGLHKAMAEHGGRCVKTNVGDRYVLEEMLKEGYNLGGEQSGHIIFSRYAATGDGILTSLMVMEACVDKKSTLCDLAKEMKVYPQLLRNVRVSDKKTALENEKVKAAIEAAAEALGDDGRILVRESGTEPLIRVMVEAGTDDLCHKYVDSVVDVMEAEGLVVE